MKKLLLIALIVGCSTEPEQDTTVPTVVITYPINNSILNTTTTIRVDVAADGN